MKTNKFLQTIKRGIFFGQILLLVVLVVNTANAQTTEFTYQGRLNVGGLQTSASHDFEFRLFGVATGGSALATQTRLGVPVANGVFTVQLDFGANFNGQPRFLEIAVKPAGSAEPFTVLTPRQPVTSAPYSIKSLNSATADTATNSLSLGGIAANQYVITTDSRLSDARNPLPGSGSYIQNTPPMVQASANFNISGSGNLGGSLSANLVSGNTVNSATQYNLGGSRILGNAGLGNLFAGAQTGSSNTGSNNAFVGAFAGNFNTTGSSNSFFGRSAGQNNATGQNNSFFGHNAGFANTASNNSFFGSLSGDSNTLGNDNSFFGYASGSSNTTGLQNSFFGANAGQGNQTGNYNSFFGVRAGYTNQSGVFNSFFGYRAGDANEIGGYNAFFGYQAGFVNLSGGSNSFFGFSAGKDNTTGDSNVFVGSSAGYSNTTGNHNTIIGAFAGVENPNLTYATAIGAGVTVGSSNRIVLGRSTGMDTVEVPGSLVIRENALINGFLRLDTLASGGSDDVCRSGGIIDLNKLSVCSSSLRYKTDIQPFTSGLTVVRRLRPIKFIWREGGMLDLGFAAEEVEQVEPLLATYNDKGEIEGVKYKQITTVLVNAVNEQQAQIEAQKKLLEQQQQQIDALKKLACQSNPQAGICKEEQK